MYLIPSLTYKIQRKRPNNLFMNLDIFLQKVAFTSISSSESILVGLVNMSAAEDCHLSQHIFLPNARANYGIFYIQFQSSKIWNDSIQEKLTFFLSRNSKRNSRIVFLKSY